MSSASRVCSRSRWFSRQYGSVATRALADGSAPSAGAGSAAATRPFTQFSANPSLRMPPGQATSQRRPRNDSGAIAARCGDGVVPVGGTDRAEQVGFASRTAAPAQLYRHDGVSGESRHHATDEGFGAGHQRALAPSEAHHVAGPGHERIGGRRDVVPRVLDQRREGAVVERGAEGEANRRCEQRAVTHRDVVEALLHLGALVERRVGRLVGGEHHGRCRRAGGGVDHAVRRSGREIAHHETAEPVGSMRRRRLGRLAERAGDAQRR